MSNPTEEENINTNDQVLKFKIDTALLRELGEQLVGSADIAISELIKNSYDADATKCEVEWTDDELVVSDNGHGMTLNELETLWMTVGTSSKLKQLKSRKYRRSLTGSKGVGRFAVRFIGKNLDLETIAVNPATGKKDKIIAQFDWQETDKTDDITNILVPYEIIPDVNDEVGTFLYISNLRKNNKPTAEFVKNT